MSEAIKIDNKLFQERVSHFVNAWKADKRSGDALFGGASSILIMMGKMEEAQGFQKNNAMHVRLLPSSSSTPPLPPAQVCQANLRRCAVLAARLRVPYHSDALHPRDPVYLDDPKERCAFPATHCAIELASET